MEMVVHYLCGGNVDFVSTHLALTDIIVLKDSEAYTGMLASTYETRSLEEAVWDRFRRERRVALVRTVGVLLLSHPAAEHDRCGLRLSTLRGCCESVQSFRQNCESKVQSRELEV